MKNITINIEEIPEVELSCLFRGLRHAAANALKDPKNKESFALFKAAREEERQNEEMQAEQHS